MNDGYPVDKNLASLRILLSVVIWTHIRQISGGRQVTDIWKVNTRTGSFVRAGGGFGQQRMQRFDVGSGQVVRSAIRLLVLHDLALNLFENGTGWRGTARIRIVGHVRLQSARCCVPTGEGRRQADHDGILEFRDTRVFTRWGTQGSCLPASWHRGCVREGGRA
jgi:hypothetical protein